MRALFCLAGAIALTRRDGSILSAGPGQVLLLTDVSSVAGASAELPLAGVLVAVDARNARESLQTICRLLGGLTLDTSRVRQRMASRGGCAVEGPTHWSRAAFAQLERLPQRERGRWCVWKSVELLYLLCAPQEPAPTQAGNLEEVARYMEEHLDEPLSIPQLSRRAFLSPTAFKAAFRQRFGLAVHAWLRQKRMERAGPAAGGLLPHCAGGGSVGGVQQRQPVYRRLPGAVRHKSWEIPENVQKGIKSSPPWQYRPGDPCYTFPL